jgi:protochlorophyllide reductase
MMKIASLFLLFASERSANSFTVTPQTTRTFHTPTLFANNNDNDGFETNLNGNTNEGNESASSISRRSAMSKSAQSVAAILLANTIVPAEPALADIQYNASSKTIFITGCNSGIGYDAVKRMAKQGHEIILACRSFAKANDAVTRIQQELDNPNLKLIPKECNLADLNSVQACVQGLSNDGIRNIDALCLNAGIARNTAATDVLRTAQGFEATIGTNHLGHFYLTNQILPLMGKNSNIIITASSVHDPDSPGGAQGSKATLGDLAGLETAVKNKDGIFDMVDGQAFDADKAYKDSKLCNVFFLRELQRRLETGDATKKKGVKVNAFTPGLIVKTGLFRDQNPIFTKVFDFVATDLIKVGESIHFGGGALEYMTLSDSVSSKSGLYYFSPPGSSKYGDGAFGNQFTATDVSIEAREDAKGKRLWDLSEQLVGIKVMV